jgi:putative ABC transport system permease protein
MRLLSRVRFSLLRRRVDHETRREIEAHLDQLAVRYIAQGMTPADAHDAARRQFGNVTHLREEIHEMNGMLSLDALGQDLKYALRQLQRRRAFSAIVIATLGLGIGGTTAVFSLVQRVLLEPLPYQQPGQLVRLYQQAPGNPSTRRAGVSATHFVVLRDTASAFSELAALHSRAETGLDLFKDGQAQRLRGLHVTKEYFTTLRAEPFHGPGFGRDDEVGTRRVVLSSALWRTRFHGDLSIIGRKIQLSSEPYEVAGIAPPGFADAIVGDVDVWLPYDLAGDTFEQNYALTIIGRLREGVGVEQSQTELDVLSQAMKQRWPSVTASSIIAVPLKEDVVGTSRALVNLLLIAVGLVLVVACVNVANLVLVRTTGRLHELAVRAALGSGRMRLIRQLLVESLVLAALGGVLGLALARLGVAGLQALGRDALPRLDAVAFDPTVFAFAAIATLATAVASGTLPALHGSRVDPGRALGCESRSATGMRLHGRIRSGLAAAQLALALALLAGAGVLLASFHRLQQVPLGFRVERVLTFDVSLPRDRYDAPRRARFQEEVARRLEKIPGVTAAGGTSYLPTIGSRHAWPTAIDSGPLAGTQVKQPEQPEHRTVSGHFFDALEIPVLAGRTFDERDDASAPARAVVSASFARTAFPGVPFDRVIGQRFRVLIRHKREIIGVVGDVSLDVYGTSARAVYSAHRQFADNRIWALTQVVSTALPPEQIFAAVRAEVAAMDPEIVVYRAAPMAEVVGRGSSRQRFALVLMAAFAAVSLTLAAIGLYGVLAYAVRQRTAEIGIRIALGATARQVRGLILRQAALVVAGGLVAGLAGALILGRWLSSLLFQVSPWDARVLGATALLLTITGLVSAWLPARRASRLQASTAMQLR